MTRYAQESRHLYLSGGGIAGTGSHNLDTGQGNNAGYCSSLSRLEANGDAQFKHPMGLAGQAAALDRCSDDPAVARPWLVDDPSHAATRAARQLRRALRAWL